MPLCPFSQHECPEHNKKGGCQLWVDAVTNSGPVQGNLSGCAMVVSVLLQAHGVNTQAAMVDSMSKVQAEISHARVEQLQYQNHERIMKAALSNPIELKEEQFNG